jgi:hypothetical protein
MGTKHYDFVLQCDVLLDLALKMHHRFDITFTERWNYEKYYNTHNDVKCDVGQNLDALISKAYMVEAVRVFSELELAYFKYEFREYFERTRKYYEVNLFRDPGID